MAEQGAKCDSPRLEILTLDLIEETATLHNQDEKDSLLDSPSISFPQSVQQGLSSEGSFGLSRAKQPGRPADQDPTKQVPSPPKTIAPSKHVKAKKMNGASMTKVQYLSTVLPPSSHKSTLSTPSDALPVHKKPQPEVYGYAPPIAEENASHRDLWEIRNTLKEKHPLPLALASGSSSVDKAGANPSLLPQERPQWSSTPLLPSAPPLPSHPAEPFQKAKSPFGDGQITPQRVPSPTHFKRPNGLLANNYCSNTSPPQVDTDRRGELVTLLRGFSKQISKHIQGLSPAFQLSAPFSSSTSLIEDVNTTYGHFRLEIHKTAPRFRPWEISYKPEAEALKTMITKTESDNAPDGQGIVLHLNQVMEFINRSRARDLPGSVPFSVKETLIKESTKEWKNIAQCCSEDVEQVVSNHLNRILEAHPGMHSKPALSRMIKGTLAGELQKCRSAMDEKINFIYAAEEQIYTQNDKLYLEYRNKWVDQYTTLLRQSRGGVAESLGRHDSKNNNRTPTWSNINSAIAAMASLGITIQSSDLAKLLPPDPMDPGVQIMADVRAYFEVAYKRFSDVIPQQLDLTFLRGLDESVDLALSRFVVGLSVEDCAGLFSSR